MSKNDIFESEFSSNDDEDTKQEKESDEDSPQLQHPNYDLIKTIAITLNMILEANKNLENYNEIISAQSRQVFSANNIIPRVSIKNYLIRIQTFSNIERSTLIISLIYIDRLCNKTKIMLTHYNIHRILFSSILIAIKYNEDNFYDNRYYSRISGVKLKELKALEYNFIKMLDCELYINRELYNKYEVYLKNFKYNDVC